MRLPVIGWLCVGLLIADAVAQSHHHHAVDDDGVVMNDNPDRLPRGCDAIADDVAFTVHAGAQWAVDDPSRTFGFSQHEFRVPACARVSVTFVNDDDVRHQWMVHGLPNYLYPAGMFHLEAAGGRQVTGRFIVPPDDRTYLVHCDMAQHMEKGMRGQLVVGRGSGDLWSVPGVSGDYRPQRYARAGWITYAAIAGLLGVALVAATATRMRRRSGDPGA